MPSCKRGSDVFRMASGGENCYLFMQHTTCLIYTTLVVAMLLRVFGEGYAISSKKPFTRYICSQMF